MKFTVERPAHFSPSTINSFIEYRPQWFLNKIVKAPFIGSPAMYRGTTVEDGVNMFVERRERWAPTIQSGDDELIEECCKFAEGEFKRRCLEGGDDPKALIDSIQPACYTAINHFIPIWGDWIPAMQHKISTKLTGVETPIIGYLDYLLPNVIQDLKVVGRSTKEIKQGYCIQGAIYNHALGLPVEFHYTVPLKTKTTVTVLKLQPNAMKWHLEYATMAAQRLETIYKVMEKPFIFQSRNDIAEVFAAMAFPNIDAFWSNKDKEAVSAMWDIKKKLVDGIGHGAMPDIEGM
jgi:hypothetical protein